MEFEEDHEHEEEEEHEGEIELTTPTYGDSLGNSNLTRANKMSPTPISMDLSAHLRKPRYRECLKNHAVGLGAHAVDGCGEFMAAGEEGTLDALKCAACNCHRNFHRKETDPSSAMEPFGFHHQQHHQPLLTHYPHGAGGQFGPPYFRTPSGYLHVGPGAAANRVAQPQPLLLPSSSGGGGEQEDVSMGGGGGSVKKRHRTKFSQEQKEKMLELAERLGWRMQKADEVVVEQFCNEYGIRRHVLKVWMHNNKNTLGKKEGTPTLPIS